MKQGSDDVVRRREELKMERSASARSGRCVAVRRGRFGRCAWPSDSRVPLVTAHDSAQPPPGSALLAPLFSSSLDACQVLSQSLLCEEVGEERERSILLRGCLLALLGAFQPVNAVLARHAIHVPVPDQPRHVALKTSLASSLIALKSLPGSFIDLTGPRAVNLLQEQPSRSRVPLSWSSSICQTLITEGGCNFPYVLIRREGKPASACLSCSTQSLAREIVRSAQIDFRLNSLMYRGSSFWKAKAWIHRSDQSLRQSSLKMLCSTSERVLPYLRLHSLLDGARSMYSQSLSGSSSSGSSQTVNSSSLNGKAYPGAHAEGL